MTMSIFSILNRWPTLVIAGIVIVGVGFQVLPIAVARAGVVLALLTQIYLELRAGDNQFMTSPLFLLGTYALLLFSLVLAVLSPPPYVLHVRNIDSFFGSDAERMLVLFGLSCIAVHNLITGCVGQTLKTNENHLTQDGKGVCIFATIALIVSLVGIANFLSPTLGGPHFTAIRSIAPPLLAFCLMFLIYQSVTASGRQKAVIAVVLILSIGGLFFVHEGKKPFFMIIAGLLYWLRLKKVSVKKIIIFGVIFIPVAVGLMQIMTVIRNPNYSMLGTNKHGPAIMFKKVFVAKLVLRQEETRFCLQNVIDQHWNQPFSLARQMYWLKGLVPRAIWEEKPNLSLGRQYTSRYCGLVENGPHSASITLLGQPIVQGGGAGLLMHGGFLMLCLGALVWLGRNPYSQSTLGVVALLPWLIDFDQDFALYVANAVKFFLVMLPLIVLSAWMDKKPSPRPKAGFRLSGHSR